MPRIRISPSASVTSTEAGILIRSDLGSFQLQGHDVRIFVEQMLPLLDGSWDREVIIDSLSSYSRESVASFLNVLEERGLLETITDERPIARRWRGQREFFRQWSNR